MATRYSVTATLGDKAMRRDFAWFSEAVLWRRTIEAQGWKTEEPVAIDVAEPAPLVPVGRAV